MRAKRADDRYPSRRFYQPWRESDPYVACAPQGRLFASPRVIWPIGWDDLVSPAPRPSGRPQNFVTRIGRIERMWRIAPRAVMHAVATSPDDLFFLDCRS